MTVRSRASRFVPARPPRARLLAAALGLCLLAARCAPEGGSATRSGPADDGLAVIDAHHALVAAYQRGDVEAFVAGLEPTPELLIFHPRVHGRFTGIDDIRAGLGRMFARLGDSRWTDAHLQVVVEGDAAWLTAQILVQSAELDPAFLGRATEIYVRRDGRWLLAHAHWSADPEADA